MKTSCVLALSEPSATLENVGGKGLSLAKMIHAGFPVPDGFHITTEAYRQFIETNGFIPASSQRSGMWISRFLRR